jgi:hypothetical protein
MATLHPFGFRYCTNPYAMQITSQLWSIATKIPEIEERIKKELEAKYEEKHANVVNFYSKREIELFQENAKLKKQIYELKQREKEHDVIQILAHKKRRVDSSSLERLGN